jgi:hypothetical protein
MVLEDLPPPTFSCDAAIDVALAALPPGHSPITSLAFSYGPHCPVDRYCVLPLPPAGHVIVTYADGTQTLVSVRGQDSGGITLTNIGPLPT